MREHKASTQIQTDRLILRHWREADREPFAAMNADPRVMEFLPSMLSLAESNAKIDGYMLDQAVHGFCFWALEDRATGEFSGYTGIRRIDFDAHFTPSVEIAWRLPDARWGRGYASEAARACLDYAFNTLKLEEIVAITTPANRRSWAVMERLGMSRDPADDFIHPHLAPDHPLQPCMLYRIGASANSTKETLS